MIIGNHESFGNNKSLSIKNSNKIFSYAREKNTE